MRSILVGSGIINDCALAVCRKAVDEFRNTNRRIDAAGDHRSYWTLVAEVALGRPPVQLSSRVVRTAITGIGSVFQSDRIRCTSATSVYQRLAPSLSFANTVAHLRI